MVKQAEVEKLAMELLDQCHVQVIDGRVVCECATEEAAEAMVKTLNEGVLVKVNVTKPAAALTKS